MPPWLLTLLLGLHAHTARTQSPPRYPAYSTRDVTSFPFDDARLLLPRHRNAGAVWVTPNAQPDTPLPLFIYLHGLNRDRIHRRWLHGSHWDLRTIIAPMVTEGRLGPMAVAVPATTSDSSLSAATIYRGFDVAAFVEATDQALAAQGFRVDRRRVIFSAHSASGCALRNGLFAAVGSPAVQTILDIDCCMDGNFARALATAPPAQRVIVVYQDWMWPRRYQEFQNAFLRLSARAPHPDGRVLEYWRMQGVDAHNDIVPVALRRWLPELVPPR